MIYGSGGGVSKQIIVSLQDRQVFRGVDRGEEMLEISSYLTIGPGTGKVSEVYLLLSEIIYRRRGLRSNPSAFLLREQRFIR